MLKEKFNTIEEAYMSLRGAILASYFIEKASDHYRWGHQDSLVDKKHWPNDIINEFQKTQINCSNIKSEMDDWIKNILSQLTLKK